MTDDTPRRPRDLALLLLALGDDPPRERARDQQADRAGARLRRTILDRLAAIDPDPQDCAPSLGRIVVEIGEPTGPARALASALYQDWVDATTTPGVWAWLLTEAIAAGEERPRRRRGRT